ncbi:MAG: hypothetical protein QOG80_1880 [Pseudonocardiales bacterium]|jgi:PPOX class probable F420-dependent enzyme|nr:hypothetical protein [Pseudonocardiales bacterium]
MHRGATVMTALPDPATPFGDRVRRRLTDERLIWLTTVGKDGTPQPNPVWFVWEGADTLLVYNRPDANRLIHLRRSDRLALHFDGDGNGGNVLVLTGVAQVVAAPPPHENPEYLAKYRDSMTRVSGSPEGFSLAYPVPLRASVENIRGF